AELGAEDVAGRANATERRVTRAPPVFEVVARRHIFGVALCGPRQASVRSQRRLAPSAPFPVDQAQRGGSDEAEVLGGRRDVGVYAGAAADGARAGGRSALERMVAPPRGSGVGEPPA